MSRQFWTKRWLLPFGFTPKVLRRVSTVTSSRILSVRNIKHPSVGSFLKFTLATHSRALCSPSTMIPKAQDTEEPSLLQCAGCGATLQSTEANRPGFTPKSKIETWQDDFRKLSEHSDSEEEPKVPIESLICQRCFSLKHYNTALNITLKADDYLTHLSALKDKRALILLMIDVSDCPTSIFPDLNTLISDASRVLIVANKTDLLPKETSRRFWKDFERAILSEATSSSLSGCNIMGVRFISAKTEHGLEELCDEITHSWGNRGDVYLLGCTNVGKSTLFNKLLSRLCGARPGELRTESSPNVPMATISQWPGTTLGLLSFPLLSVGKIQRLKQQRERMERQQHQHSFYEDESLEEIAFDGENILNPKEAKKLQQEATDIDDVLAELGIGKNKEKHGGDPLPLNKYWLHDTPGAINDAQLINFLTTKELKLALPKKPLQPRTVILKPGQCLFIGGLARLDYAQGPDSAYFTVFAASYLPVHTSKVSKADSVYQNLLGTPVLKVPVNEPDDRLSSFPPLLPQDIHLHGESWKRSAADIVLSSAGWVSFTIGQGLEATLTAHTPLGRGVAVRRPPLYPLAVNDRGKRSRSGNRAEFKGK